MTLNEGGRQPLMHDTWFLTTQSDGTNIRQNQQMYTMIDGVKVAKGEYLLLFQL